MVHGFMSLFMNFDLHELVSFPQDRKKRKYLFDYLLISNNWPKIYDRNCAQNDSIQSSLAVN